MKLKKKTAMIAGFTVGALLFATTAFADIVSKSGYEQLKDGFKIAAEKASHEYENYTIELNAVIKDNGKVLEANSSIEKHDRVKNASEQISTMERYNGETNTYYSYNDAKTTIRSGMDGNKVYVGEYPEGREVQLFNNPFEEDEAEDVERIIDAVVGSLKDHVIVTENPDGTKDLNGSLSEMQIPTLVNAVSSFALKQEFHNTNVDNGRPNLSKNIAVHDVTGSASLNKEGALESILALVTVKGTDANGQEHEITIEILGNLKDINSTVVTKPDLAGKEIVKEVLKDHNSLNNPQKYVGTFKNNIVTEKDGKFVKAGERILEITQIDDKGITGRYHEEYKPGFEEYADKFADFNFNAAFINEDMRDARVEIPSDKGGKVEAYIYLDDYQGKVNFHLNKENMGMSIMFDSTFNPVLE